MNFENIKDEKIKLKRKIDALDLYESGEKIIEISRKLYFSKNNLYYWLEKEDFIRKKYSEICEIENLKSNENNSNEIKKEIKKRIKNFKIIQPRSYTPTEKLNCVDLVKSGHSYAWVSRKTGYNHCLISNWVQCEEKLRKLVNNPKPVVTKVKKPRVYNYRSKEGPKYRLEDKLNNLSKEKQKDNIPVRDFSLNNEMMLEKNDRLNKYLKRKHSAADLQTKIYALDLLDEGHKQSRVAEFLNVPYATVEYWRLMKCKLRKEAEEVNRIISLRNNNDGGGGGGGTEQRSNKKRISIRSIRKFHRNFQFSVETKMDFCRWEDKLTNYSWLNLARIFGHHRYGLMQWFENLRGLVARYECRERWRRERLDSLLLNTDHKAEIRTLKRLMESEDILGKLSGYLSFGITYSYPKLSTRLSANFRFRVQRIGKIGKSATLKPPSNDMQSIFEQLYRHEYEVLYLIDKRYSLLTDQHHLCEEERKPIIDQEMDLLKNQLLTSLDKLITLHLMMTD